jgi:hypothetical protein
MRGAIPTLLYLEIVVELVLELGRKGCRR